ncbi:transposase family protein [Streptomyces sp. NPDC059918]|uniref:transposase family protein n=1 Tax=unclassified Streptomyces TaxID=2593676 RepID=UPI00364A5199
MAAVRRACGHASKHAIGTSSLSGRLVASVPGLLEVRESAARQPATLSALLISVTCGTRPPACPRGVGDRPDRHPGGRPPVQAAALQPCPGRTGVPAQERHLKQLAASLRDQRGYRSRERPRRRTLPAGRAPGLTAALRAANAPHLLLDGTLAGCDRVGDRRAEYSGKHRRRGANPQVSPDRTEPWSGFQLLSRAGHDLGAARRHRIITTRVLRGILVLADEACQGAGDSVAVPHRRWPDKDLTVRQRCVNRPYSRLRWPAERTIAGIKTWRILRKARTSPNKFTPVARAVLTWRLTPETVHCHGGMGRGLIGGGVVRPSGGSVGGSRGCPGPGMVEVSRPVPVGLQESCGSSLTGGAWRAVKLPSTPGHCRR